MKRFDLDSLNMCSFDYYCVSILDSCEFNLWIISDYFEAQADPLCNLCVGLAADLQFLYV